MVDRSRNGRVKLYEPPPRIKHCIQLGATGPEKDCGVACAAMIAGTEYLAAWIESNTVSPRWPAWGLSSQNMVDILRELTGEEWCYRSLPRPRPLLDEFADWPDTACVCIIRRDGDKKGHLVVWQPHGRFVHDPAWHCGLRLKTYLGMLEDGVRLIGTIQRVQTDPPDGAA